MCVLPLQVAELVNDGFFTDMLFYRIIQGFLAQFGVPADHAAYHKWNSKPRLLDEPNLVPFRRGEAKARRPSVQHPCASHAAASHPSVTHSHTQLSLSRNSFFYLSPGRRAKPTVCLSVCRSAHLPCHSPSLPCRSFMATACCHAPFAHTRTLNKFCLFLPPAKLQRHP